MQKEANRLLQRISFRKFLYCVMLYILLAIGEWRGLDPVTGFEQVAVVTQAQEYKKSRKYLYFPNIYKNIRL